MADKLFDLGFDGGVTSSAGYEEDGQIILTETMPARVVQEILDANKETAREDPLGQARAGKTLGVIGARIPITVHHKLKHEWKTTARLWGVPWHTFLKKKLNSADFKNLRFMKL